MRILRRVAVVGGFLAGLLGVLVLVAGAVTVLVLGGVPFWVVLLGALLAFVMAVWLVLRFRRRGAESAGAFSESVFTDRSAGKGGLL